MEYVDDEAIRRFQTHFIPINGDHICLGHSSVIWIHPLANH